MIMNHISQLTEALQRGNLALFVGADLPQTLTGLPSRADLASGLPTGNEKSGSMSAAGFAAGP